MSGCKGSDGLGMGEGLPACLSLSGCLSSKNMCGVCSSSSSSETVFKCLIVGEKLVGHFPFISPPHKKTNRGINWLTVEPGEG